MYSTGEGTHDRWEGDRRAGEGGDGRGRGMNMSIKGGITFSNEAPTLRQNKYNCTHQ